VASALIANGVGIVGRSLKYHRPRGFYGAGLEDPNAIVSVRDHYGYTPAICAGAMPLAEGLDVRTVTGWPSARFDLGAGTQLLNGVLSAGFYYKTFKWPSWRWFEPAIKRSTGFGRLRREPATRNATPWHDTCDVLVVGGGPAGLSAARVLAGKRLRVVVADEQPRLGGTLLWEQARVDDMPGLDWVRKAVSELDSDDAVTVLNSTVVSAAYEGNFFTLVQSLHDDKGVAAERLWQLRARHVVLATGLIDRPIVFQNNDRPGIMLSCAARRFIGQYAAAPARSLAVYTNNDSGYRTAIAAQCAGIDVPVLVDSRSRSAALHAEKVERLGIPCLFEAEVADTRGYKALRGIVVRERSGAVARVACAGLAVAGGWTPLIHLAAHRGIEPRYDARLSMLLCPDAPQGWHIVGGAAGALTLEAAVTSGHRAAVEICAENDRPVSVAVPRAVSPGNRGSIAPVWRTRTGRAAKMWVDLQNDVRVADIELAACENYVCVEHLKRYTTLGMGPDQGRTSSVNGLGILATLTGRDPDAVGTTTYRPPYAGIPMGAIAHCRQGDLYQPRRLMPAHAAHRIAGAAFEDFGWERPDWFRSNGDDRESAVAVEMNAVRSAVGVFDASPLGKIEVAGPDARNFLDRFYVSNLLTQKPGRVRYSVMLREDGVILDDGVVTCISENHFLASPTSGQAEPVAAWLERWRQIEWPKMKVAVVDVTSNWASMAIAGPRARDLLARLAPSFDISGRAFPHMHFREGRVAGVPARVARVSFTGELQYEITVPARFAEALLARLLKEGAGLSPRCVGMEAWLRLRLEKGYIHLGSDTNGRTTPDDIGMGNIAARKENDFIGKRSLSLTFNRSRDRERLVGLVADGDGLEVGGRVLAPGSSGVPCRTVGYVTSACYSPAAGTWIGMALIERGNERQGENVLIRCSGNIVEAQIRKPCFYDADNARLKA